MKESLWTRNMEAEPVVSEQADHRLNKPRSKDTELLRIQRQVDRLTLTCQSKTPTPAATPVSGVEGRSSATISSKPEGNQSARRFPTNRVWVSFLAFS
mgnify:CR=1 FL=1